MSRSKAIALAEPTAVQLVLELADAGALTPVSLDLTDPDMSFDRWLSLGRFFGQLDRSSRWYIGDWLIFGEGVFGEESAQGVEATTQERYSEAERITGLDPGTLTNIRSICARVAKARRRPELGFWIHEVVAPLEPEEQNEWLQRAVDEGLTKSELRLLIRESKNPVGEEAEEPAGSGALSGISIGERIETAARLVLAQSQSTSDGSFLVPAEPIMQLRAALGGE